MVSVQCSAGGCLIELAQQLAVIMIGKQIINNAQEILMPKMKAWWQKKQVNTGLTESGESREYLFHYALLNNAVSSSIYCII
jgi:anoctamin-7